MDETGRLHKQIEELKTLLKAAMTRIAELEARLKTNSGNSSKPPSSDLGGRKRKPPEDPTGRRRGGQNGHDGKTRDLVPDEEVAEVIDRDPEQCEKCGEPLGEAPRLDAFIRQVTETPEWKAFVQQYNLWLKRCPKCGALNRGRMPDGSPKGAFGPRIQARIGMLSGRFRLTRRETRALVKDMFGVRISLGSVQSCCKEVSEAVAGPVETIQEAAKTAKAVWADETGFGRCGKNRMWLWVAVMEDAEVFRLLPGRGREQALELLGDGFSGFLHRDRWKPYEQFDRATHQLCHSHLRRDFQCMLESLGETGTQGAMLKLASDKAFHHWHQFEREEIDRPTLIQRMKPVQKEMKQRLEIMKAGVGITKKARGTAKDILRQWDKVWTFVTEDGVTPGNNEAERAIRKAVIWRKTSLGVDSDDGCRFVERMLTLAGTTRRRGIHLLDWLTRAVQARLSGEPAPDLRS
jgi:transposase